ncbi:MAG: F0F1 ATP synthase subunit delta [Verrucomicrobium sp.]|nr:F0F1 ATP synthase subunit delta [Verrucomicrobium sp.]
MRIDREARREARKLYRSCLENGRLSEALLRAVIGKVAEEKPRGYLAILHRLKKLAEIEVAQRTHTVESAVELPDKGASLLKGLEERFGAPLAVEYKVDPTLLGGVRLRVGSQLWDGSVRQRLRALTLS